MYSVQEIFMIHDPADFYSSYKIRNWLLPGTSVKYN